MAAQTATKAWFVGAALLLCASFAAPGTAGAAEPLQRLTKTVGVLPVHRLDLSCEELFASGQRDDTSYRYVEKALAAALGGLDDVKVLNPKQLRNRVAGRKSYKDKLVVGRNFFLLGKEHYQDLRQKEAEGNFGQAVELLESIFYDMVEPSALAEVLTLLGVTLIEEERFAYAHQAFKRALFVAPAARFVPGYYPQPVETAILDACQDLRHSAPREMPLGSLERTVSFLNQSKLDALFFPVVLNPHGQDLVLMLVGFEARGRTLPYRVEIPLTDEASVADQVDRAISAWGACTPFEFIRPKVEERNKYLFAASYQHSFYLQKPTRLTMSSMGFSFDIGHFFRKSFGLLAKVQLMSSLADNYEDLLDGFTAVRGLVGPAFSLSGSWWRLFVIAGLDLTYMGSFTVSRDPDCKFFESDSSGYESLCGKVTEYPANFMVGINVNIGAQFFVAKDIFLGVGANITTYFVPFERSSDLNFPIGLELGGGIAF